MSQEEGRHFNDGYDVMSLINKEGMWSDQDLLHIFIMIIIIVIIEPLGRCLNTI